MALFITAYRKRSCTFTLTITQSDGTNVTFTAGDVMRLKIGRLGGSAPLLDLDSAAASSNGSSMTAANPSTVVLDQGDLDLHPGSYEVEAGIVDDSDSDRFKHADTGLFVLHRTLEGDVALT